MSELMRKGLSGISPVTAIPASAARMAGDGVLKMRGAELERAAPVLSFADRGPGGHNLTLLRLDSGFNEESLGCFDIVDEMEVEKEDEACLRCTLELQQKSRFSSSMTPHGHYTQTPVSTA